MMNIRFRKLLAVLMVAALMVAAVGCGKAESSSEAPARIAPIIIEL